MQNMQNLSPVQWQVSENVCALCDSERHLAHLVMLRSRWFAFDATRSNEQGTGFKLLGSFARLETAMEIIESETLGIRQTAVQQPLHLHLPSAA